LRNVKLSVNKMLIGAESDNPVPLSNGKILKFS
jgi:hypothetical protein